MPPEGRRHTPTLTELIVLDRSRRRCALCFHIDGDLTEKHGQIAHADKDPTNSAEDNLVWLCLPHHSVFDSKTSQHKNYTSAEVKRARDTLYEAVMQGRHTPRPLVSVQGRNADRATLSDTIQRLSEVIQRFRDWTFDGTSFPVERIEPIEIFLWQRRGPEVEFVDNELEAIRKLLIDALDRFSRLIVSGTRPGPGQEG